ncbi:MAG: sensor histidine kinase [Kiritimatiellia bacterium]
MFWKHGDWPGVSLRGRMVLSTFLTSGLLAILAAVAVSAFAYRYLIGDVDARLQRLATDLQGEYAAFRGLTPEFVHCMHVDAEEHNARLTFIMVTDATNGLVHATPMPVGYRERLLHMQSRGRYRGRFYTERDDTEPDTSRGAVRYRSLPLVDGGRVTVARDVTPVERFLIAQAVTLGCVSFLITVLSGVSSYFVGGRILNLNRLVEEKDRAYVELRHLTDDIAHDLRTPLSRLSMAAETEAAGGALTEPLAQQVMDETGAMLELIGTMLEISQAEARIDRTPRMELDLSAFVRHAGEIYSAVAEDAGLELSVEAPGTPLVFAGHKGKLQQLIANLVENAIKFTPKGGRIVLTLTRLDNAARLSVADTGCGIAAADIPFVFKRFWRADASRHQPGNGLGLALVKAIATSYGGTVTCASAPGKGSVFTVILPLSELPF